MFAMNGGTTPILSLKLASGPIPTFRSQPIPTILDQTRMFVGKVTKFVVIRFWCSLLQRKERESPIQKHPVSAAKHVGTSRSSPAPWPRENVRVHLCARGYSPCPDRKALVSWAQNVQN
jgi:hypothetical protein